MQIAPQLSNWFKPTCLAILIPIAVLLSGCSSKEPATADSKESEKTQLPLETPNTDSFGGPIFLPSTPENFEISRAGYDAGTAFKLRTDNELVSRIDVLVTFEPPATDAEKLEMVNKTIDNDLNLYRNEPEMKILEETVLKPADLDLNSKIRSDLILKLAPGVLPEGDQFLVRTIVFFDKYYFHVRIQAGSEESLEKLTHWGNQIQFVGEP